MEFRNEPVDPGSLPALERLELSPVSSRFAPCRALGWVAGLLPALVVAWILPGTGQLPVEVRPLLVVAVILLAAGLALLAWFEARQRAFGLRERDLVYRSGLLIRRTTVLPFTRIQHVETASNPLERAFNLVRLTCFTAGGASADLVVQGLERDAGERLREHLLQRVTSASSERLRGADD